MSTNATDNTNTLSKPTYIPFMRMTVLGMTGCGKTAFVNAFINSTCPSRYVSTEQQVLYYKKMEVRDEGEYDELQRPIFIEVEDTAGSEKGPAGAGGGNDGGAPRVCRGARVAVIKDLKKVQQIFNSEEWRDKLEFKPAMEGMLGKEYTVKIMARDGSVGLPSPDGSEGGVWNFPKECVELKVNPEGPLDKFLNMSQKNIALPKDPQKRKEMVKDFERPLAAYQRPIGPPDQDKSLTRNRMGFFICFDVSEEDSASLKEAMNIHNQLKKYLKSKKNEKGILKPVVMLVGTKSDQTLKYKAIEVNKVSARMLCDEEDIKLIVTSAKTNENVTEAFQQMVDQISSNQGLWELGAAGDEDGGGEGGNDGTCAIA